MAVESSILGAIASPRRQEILRLVWNQELGAGTIHASLPDVTFGAVSQHLRVLLDAGVIEARTEGRHRYYRAQRAALEPARQMLEQMWADALWRLKLDAELEQSRRGPRARRRRLQRGN